MKLVIFVLSLVLSFSAPSDTLLFRSGDQAILDKRYPVQGDNPLEFCHEPSNYILTLDHVDLTPNPPVPCVLYTLLPELIT